MADDDVSEAVRGIRGEVVNELMDEFVPPGTLEEQWNIPGLVAMLERDLGIPMKKQINNAEHVVMDVEHAHLLMQVAQKYAATEAARLAILRGARKV